MLTASLNKHLVSAASCNWTYSLNEKNRTILIYFFVKGLKTWGIFLNCGLQRVLIWLRIGTGGGLL